MVASRSGATAMALMERIDGDEIRMVVVSPQYGSMEEHPFDLSLIPRLSDAGRALYAGATPFRKDPFHGCSAPKRTGDVLRIFSQAVRVCVEIPMMAADGGLLRYDRPSVAIAGTGRGADTALIATPASMAKLEEMRLHEILCKPHLIGDA